MATIKEIEMPNGSVYEIEDAWAREVINSGGGGGQGTTVIPNPTMQGDEPSLNGIQIGSNKYQVLPAWTAADNGKVLGIVNGQLAWIVAEAGRTLSSITATKTKTSYNTGDVLSDDDVTVTALYSDSTTAIVTTWTSNAESINMDTPGSKTLVILYSEGGVQKSAEITITVTQVTPVPPETGTWQFKATPTKKYIMMGSDDDNANNAKVYRMLRTYNVPYVMNVEAESTTTPKPMGSDVSAEYFTDDDAPALYPDGVDIVQMGKDMVDAGNGEVAQHGSSAHTLWDSDQLTGDYLDGRYSIYTTAGGTKTKEEFKAAVMADLVDTDVRQGASYILDSKEELEDAYGFPVTTVGAWGGTPTATVDGIDIDLNSIKTGSFDWRGNGYWAVSNSPGTWHHSDRNPYNIPRMSYGEAGSKIDELKPGEALEFYSHFGTISTDLPALRAALEELTARDDIIFITRYDYAQLGEFVDNPITGVTVTRSGSLSVGDTDSDAAYTVVVTYQDGTTGAPASDFVLDRSSVNTSTAGTYTAYAHYRGFTAQCTVAVMGGIVFPEGFKDTGHWFVLTSGGKYYIGNSTLPFLSGANNAAEILFFKTDGNGKISGWTSDDDGETWTQVTTNRPVYNGQITTNASSDTDSKYGFGFNWKTKITLVDQSGEMVWSYPYH